MTTTRTTAKADNEYMVKFPFVFFYTTTTVMQYKNDEQRRQ
jgi:hypothetical protein